MTEIHPDNIGSVWEAVRIGLQKVKDRTGAIWLPEDVYAALKSRNAVLFVQGEGFAVLQRTTELDGARLFVWALYAPGMYRDHGKAVMEELKEMARTIGAKALQMKSPRKGWERCGWTPKEIVYEVEL